VDTFRYPANCDQSVVPIHHAIALLTNQITLCPLPMDRPINQFSTKYNNFITKALIHSNIPIVIVISIHSIYEIKKGALSSLKQFFFD
jgi:hypothetical protein